MYMYGYRNGLKQRKNIISAKDKIYNHGITYTVFVEVQKPMWYTQIKQLRLQLYNNINNIIYKMCFIDCTLYLW